MLTVPNKIQTGATNNQPTPRLRRALMTRQLYKKNAFDISIFLAAVFGLLCHRRKAEKKEKIERGPVVVPPHFGGDSTIQRSRVYKTKSRNTGSYRPSLTGIQRPSLHTTHNPIKPTQTGAKTTTTVTPEECLTRPDTTGPRPAATANKHRCVAIHHEPTKPPFHDKTRHGLTFSLQRAYRIFSRPRHHRERRGHTAAWPSRPNKAYRYFILSLPTTTVSNTTSPSKVTYLHVSHPTRPSAK